VYSVAATLITWLAYPSRERWLRTLPPDVANTAFSALVPAYAFISFIYFL
jgi:hypothetical protein